MLIVDLDDTIFQTTSMRKDIFEPAISMVQNYCLETLGVKKAEQARLDLWRFPFDVIAEKYQLPSEIGEAYFRMMNEMDYELTIYPFEDYIELQQMDRRKILVTTGFKKLQSAKIEALNIKDDFEAIFIDEPHEKNRRFKKERSEHILKNLNLHPRDTWVIGDNPESELKAGKTLGMNTIQRLKPSTQKSSHADYVIHTFKELAKIIQ